VGSTKLIKGLSKQGAQVSRAGANVIAGLTWAGNVTDAVQIMDQINNLANKWENLTPEQQDQELKSLGITLAMKTASVKKGGGKFRDEIDFIRLRSMIEHRCPYPVNNVDPDPKNPGRTIWVKNDGGKMTIEFVGKRRPQEMIDLHADAAGAMQASYTIVNRLKRKLGLGDSDQFPKGSVAWEADHEITKIGKEIDLNVRKMAGADQATRKKLIARQVELQAALIRENAKLEYFDQPGTGKVASPETGVDAAEARGWVTYQKGKKKGQKKEWLEEREKEGYSWVATDGEPHLYAPDKPSLYFNEYYGEFITKAKMAAIKESAGKIERSFDQDFHDDGAPVFDDNGALLKEIDYDKEINSVKGFPNLKGIKLTPETRATLMAEAFGRTVEQVGDIAQMMGSPLAKEHLSAWEQAIEASPPAQLALDEIRFKSKLADVAEQKGDHKRAIALRKQAGKLAGDAYNPVRSQFWKRVHSDPEFASLKAKIDDMGFTFEKGRAPYLKVPNPDDPKNPFEIGVTLEHFDRKTDYPLHAQDAERLLFSFRYENVVILEHIRRIQRKRMGVNPGEKPNQ